MSVYTPHNQGMYTSSGCGLTLLLRVRLEMAPTDDILVSELFFTEIILYWVYKKERREIRLYTYIYPHTRVYINKSSPNMLWQNTKKEAKIDFVTVDGT